MPPLPLATGSALNIALQGRGIATIPPTTIVHILGGLHPDDHDAGFGQKGLISSPDLCG